MSAVMISMLLVLTLALLFMSTSAKLSDNLRDEVEDRARTTTPMPVMSHQLTITLQNKTRENGASKHNGADLWCTLYGNKATSAKLYLTPKKHDFVPGQTYSFIMSAGKDVGSVQSVVLYWKANSALITTPKQSLWLQGNAILRNLTSTPIQYRPTMGQKFEEKNDYLTTRV